MTQISSGRIASSAARKSTPDSRPSRTSIITTEGSSAAGSRRPCWGSPAVAVVYPRSSSRSASEALKSTSSSTMRTRRSDCSRSLCGFDTAQLQRVLDRANEQHGIEWLDQYSLCGQPFGGFVLIRAHQDGRKRATLLAQLEKCLDARQERHAIEHQAVELAGSRLRHRAFTGGCHGGAIPIAFEIIGGGLGKFRLVIGDQQQAARPHLRDGLEQIPHGKRLVQHTGCPTLDGAGDELIDAQAGHHDDLSARIELAELEERLDAVHSRQLDVHYGYAELEGAEQLERLLAAVCYLHLIAAQLQQIGNAFGMVLVVIDDKNAMFHAAMLCRLENGRLMRTTVPFPGRLSMQIAPRCCSTSCLTVGSPSPVPKFFVLKSGSKMRGNTSGAIPGPVSLITISSCSQTRVATQIVCGPGADA